MSNTRIQIKREDFVKAMVEVSAPPRALVEKLERPPFCHLLSTYVIRPVACEQNPFIIHHKNKQPMYVSQKEAKQGGSEQEVQLLQGLGDLRIAIRLLARSLHLSHRFHDFSAAEILKKEGLTCH